MPLVYQRNIDTNTKLGVWEITESEVFFTKSVSLRAAIGHPFKRLQHLAGRKILPSLFPDFPLAAILIDEQRKPYLEDHQYHFSISHCGKYAAAIVSRKARVGIDIEIPIATVLAVKHKFLSEDEKVLIENCGLRPLQAYTLAWSVKEALFKWYGKGQVDFRKDMKIKSLHREPPQFVLDCIFYKEENKNLRANAIFFEEHVLVWIV